MVNTMKTILSAQIVWLFALGVVTCYALPYPEPSVALSVTSIDGKTVVSIDATVGQVTAISFEGHSVPVSGGATSLGGCIDTTHPLVFADPMQSSTVTITKTLKCSNVGSTIDGVLRNYTVDVNDTFYPAEASVAWTTSITRVTQQAASVPPSDSTILSTGFSPFTVPITTSIAFLKEAIPGLSFFTTWGNGCVFNNNGPGQHGMCFTTGPWRMPMRMIPFTTAGSWRYGAASGTMDSMTIPIATVAATDARDATPVGFSLALDPADNLLELELSRNDDTIAFARLLQRLDPEHPGDPIAFTAHIVGHKPGWRAGLHWYTTAFSRFFLPKVGNIVDFEGLGSYSWYQGMYNATRATALGFKTNWDLSGTWMPYDGLFLPYQEEWLNLGPINEGLEQYNVTYDVIETYYADILKAGFKSLSYFDIGNWGTQTKLPAPNKPPLTCGTRTNGKGAPCPTPAGGNQYLQDVLRPALLQHGWSLARGSWQTYQSDWVGTTDMDPAEEVFADLLSEQAQRHVQRLPSFQGIAIDRLDYSEFFNTDRDDNVSWVPTNKGVVAGSGPYRKARSLRFSYRSMFERLHQTFHVAPPAGQEKVMLMNCNSLCRIDLLPAFDGTFSEGAALNGVAWTGLQNPTILWTYGLSNKSAHELDAFFQQHLAMNVYPMAPMPKNDHSIDPGDAFVEAMYVTYAPLFTAMVGSRWILDVAGPVVVTDAPAERTVNAGVDVLVVGDCDDNTVTWQQNRDGSLRLESANSNCLDAWSCGTANGTMVDVYTCHPNGKSECGYTNQQWIIDSPTTTIRNKNSGACLTTTSLDSGAAVVLDTCQKGLSSQKFSFSTADGLIKSLQDPSRPRCASVPPPPPRPPQPAPAWTGAVPNAFRTPQGHILAPIVLMDATVSEVNLTFRVLPTLVTRFPRAAGAVHVETMVPATVSRWVPHADVVVAGGQIEVKNAPVARGAVLVRISAPTPV
eukprot:m.777446 g.777446  ORF g.777446 m.777446 type:complete len:964 (-) comp23264_c0_seq2:304-3195(-)